MFEPPYKWIVSFDEGVYSFEVFATTIDVTRMTHGDPTHVSILFDYMCTT